MQKKDRNKWLGIFTVLLLLAISFIFAKFQGGFASWFIFYACLIFSLYEAIVVVNGLTGFKVQRKLNKKYFASGEKIHVILDITRSYPLPIPWLMVTNKLMTPWNDFYSVDEKDQERHLLFPWFKRKFKITYTLNGLPRGVYRFQEIDLETGDLFGFIRMSNTVKNRDEIVVYPRYQRLPAWSSSGRQGNSPKLVDYRSVGDETTVVGAREYVQGDKLSKIHWKASAKGIDWKTKEFETHSSNEFLFILNTRLSDYTSMDALEGLERAIKTTASLCYTSLNNKGSFSLVIVGQQDSAGSISRHIPFSGHQEQFIKALRSLAQIGIKDHPANFGNAVIQKSAGLKGGETLVLITPVITEEFTRHLRGLIHKQISVEVFLISDIHKKNDDRQRLSGLTKYGINGYLIDDDDINKSLAPYQQSGRERYGANQR